MDTLNKDALVKNIVSLIEVLDINTEIQQHLNFKDIEKYSVYSFDMFTEQQLINLDNELYRLFGELRYGSRYNLDAICQTIKESAADEVVSSLINNLDAKPSTPSTPARPIHHEHLAGLSQHDWYVKCEQTNKAIALEDAIYRVFVKEQGQNDENSFTCLKDLGAWAGY